MSEHNALRDDETNSDGETEASRERRKETFETEPVVRLLTPAAKVKILLPLVDAAGGDLSASDVAEQAFIDTETFYRHIDELIDLGAVEKTRKAGNAQMYRAVMESEAIQGFIHIYDGARMTLHDDA